MLVNDKMKAVLNYLKEIRSKFKDTDSRELSYRSVLETLIRDLKLGEPINEGKAMSVGRLDLVIKREGRPICYIETKDIGKDLDNKQFKEQFDKYKGAEEIDHLIITNYLEFRFYKNGNPWRKTHLAKVVADKIKDIPTNYQEFTDFVHVFCAHEGEPIKSSEQLAENMADIAKVLKKDLCELTATGQPLHEQYEAMKKMLIDTLKVEEFADMYAQTLTYGMFVARINDKDSNKFDITTAAKLIPKSNSFLNGLFRLILNDDIGNKVKVTLDKLVNTLRITDVDAVLKDVASERVELR